MDCTCTVSRDRQFSSWAKSSGKLALLRICPNKCCRSILAAVLSQTWLQIGAVQMCSAGTRHIASRSMKQQRQQLRCRQTSTASKDARTPVSAGVFLLNQRVAIEFDRPTRGMILCFSHLLKQACNAAPGLRITCWKTSKLISSWTS